MTYPVTCIPLVVIHFEAKADIVHSYLLKNFRLRFGSEAQASKEFHFVCSRGQEKDKLYRNY